MKTRKILAAFLCILLVFAYTTSALAATTYYEFEGSCKKNFVTSGYLSKSTSQTWTQFSVYISRFVYTGDYDFIYLYARPQGTDGTVFATQYLVYHAATKNFTPNSSGSVANSVKMKIYNPAYQEYGNTSTTLTAKGNTQGVIG